MMLTMIFITMEMPDSIYEKAGNRTFKNSMILVRVWELSLISYPFVARQAAVLGS
jgi:hypothetical protein